jgi:hypothetical protein
VSWSISELFGYPLGAHSAEAVRCRQECQCPFSGAGCDGGGNRYQSAIRLAGAGAPIREFYRNLPDAQSIPAGVCTLGMADSKWVVCPRRLFQLSPQPSTAHSEFCASILRRYLPGGIGRRFAVWSEVRLKFRAEEADDDQDFDYRFDFVASEVADTSPADVAKSMGVEVDELWKLIRKRSPTGARGNSDTAAIANCPIGPPLVIEVMTSSTSGGNKEKQTTIPQAFQQALLGKPHTAPGINYRQVWARMVSQLFVKSQVSRSWGGHTIWIVQDSLSEYMARTTALQLVPSDPTRLDDINILSLGVEENGQSPLGIRPLVERALYCGALPSPSTAGDFVNLLLASVAPPLSELHRVLLARQPLMLLKRE